MNKVKEIFKDKKLYIFLLISLVFFGIFVRTNFATDTYAVIGYSRENITDNFLRSGRIITALWWNLMCFTKLTIGKVHFISAIVAFGALTLSLYKICRIIEKDLKNEILSIILSTVIIINPFSLELFMYIENGIMILAVLFCICALESFIKILDDDNKKKNIILSLIYMTLAVFCYQGVVAIFVALSVIYILRKSEKFTEFIKNLVLSLIIYGVPALLNFIIVRFVFVGQRVDGEIEIMESISKLIFGCKSMLITYFILPKYFYMACLGIILLVYFYAICHSKKWLEIIKLCFLVFITTILTILPQAMQNTDFISFVPRSTYAFASIFGMIELMCVLFIKENLDNNKLEEYTKNIIVVLSSVFLMVQFYRFNFIEVDHYNMNYLDKSISLKIGQMIEEYEKTTGNKVEKISIYKDSETVYGYSNLFIVGDINASGFDTSWSDANMINYYNNLNLKKVKNNEEIKQHFSEENWDKFNEKQVVFEGDTLHLCIY